MPPKPSRGVTKTKTTAAKTASKTAAKTASKTAASKPASKTTAARRRAPAAARDAGPQSAPEVVVTLIYSERCPHCVEFMPTWESFVATCRRRWAGGRVVCRAWPWDAVAADHALLRRFADVRLVPHVSLEAGPRRRTEVLDPTLPRTRETLLAFVAPHAAE